LTLCTTEVEKPLWLSEGTDFRGKRGISGAFGKVRLLPPSQLNCCSFFSCVERADSHKIKADPPKYCALEHFQLVYFAFSLAVAAFISQRRTHCCLIFQQSGSEALQCLQATRPSLAIDQTPFPSARRAVPEILSPRLPLLQFRTEPLRLHTPVVVSPTPVTSAATKSPVAVCAERSQVNQAPVAKPVAIAGAIVTDNSSAQSFPAHGFPGMPLCPHLTRASQGRLFRARISILPKFGLIDNKVSP
jgi:hypothetical protein